MKKLVFLTVLALIAATSVAWGLTVVNDGFEGYDPGILMEQEDTADPYLRKWGGATWATTSVELNYEATTDPVSDGWTVLAESTGLGGTVTDGILHISDPSSTKIKYTQDLSGVNNTLGTTISFRARCTSSTSTYTNTGTYTIEFQDNAQALTFGMSADGIRVHDMNLVTTPAIQGPAYAMDCRDWHTYTITVKNVPTMTTTRVSVYVDDNPSAVISGVMNDTTNGTPFIRFGCGSTSIAQELDVDYLRLKTGGTYIDQSLAKVVTDPVSTGSKAAKWFSVGSGSVEKSISKLFPIQWKTGTCELYASILMHMTVKAGQTGGNTSYLRMYDAAGPEACRFYIDRNSTNGGELKILAKTAGGVLWQPVLVANPSNDVWYKIKLAVDIDARRYNAYLWNDGTSSWDLKAENAYFYFAATGLGSVTWTMYERGSEYEDGAYISLDDLRIVGPDNLVPAFTSPGADCGWSSSFRYFTLAPTFTATVDPNDAYQVKVFTKAVVDGAGFDVYTSATVWDSLTVSKAVSSDLSMPYGGTALTASDMGNPPSNVYYVFARAHNFETNVWGNFSGGVDFVVRDGVPLIPATPIITAPVSNVTSTTPPTVTWTVASGEWDQSNIVITDTTTATEYFNSNWTTGLSPVNLATLPTPPPALQSNHVYSMAITVRKGCTNTAGYESGTDTEVWACYTATPAAPIVDAPTDPNQGLQPVILFHGDPHTLLEAKITTDALGNTLVGDLVSLSSTAFGANTNTVLTAGNLYYAWARIGNPLGWSAWSAPSSFHAVRTAEAMDVRHMDEAGLLTSRTAYPDDMFNGGLPGTLLVQTGCTLSQPVCTPGVLRVTDLGVGGLLQKHNCIVNFNKGTTVLAAVRTWVAEGSDVGEDWKSGTIIVTDADNHCGASIKVRPDQIAICVNGTDWNDSASLTPNNDFRVIRITAKAAIYNDPSSIEWNVYVDETWQLTAFGAATESQFGPVGSWVTSQITIGQGSYGLLGTTDFDWTAVNGSGVYAPGDWNEKLAHYVPAGSLSPRDWQLTDATYADVSDAIKNGETGWATITASNAVISHVGTIAYYVQDALAASNSLKIDAVGNPADLGMALDDITGFLSSDGVVKVVKGGVVNIASSQPDPALRCTPVVSSIKVLGGSPCVTQLAGLGGPFVDNRGKLVRIFGLLPANPSDPGDPVPGYPSGAQILYVDDLSNPSWVLDGRDGELPGLRILLDMSYETQIWDPLLSTGIGLGSVVQVTGVSTTEDYLVGGAIKTVRKIADPVIVPIVPVPGP